MPLPTPDSLIAVVKPEPDTVDTFIERLSAIMADADTIKDAYRGGGLFSFYVEGYLVGHDNEAAEKKLVEAGYQVHLFKQRIGYFPPPWWIDVASCGHDDVGVTGTSQTLWYLVQVSKKKVD